MRTYVSTIASVSYVMNMMGVLGNVIGIMDMDGFYINGRFYCKELGMFEVGNVYAESYLFDINMKWSELNEKAKRQCYYVIRNVHRLPFGVPEGVIVMKLSQLDGIVSEFYSRYKTSVASLLAYKGGQYERDLLNRLGIPNVNLETYGCPKAEVIFGDLGWLETCGNHLTVSEAYKHCPKVETEAFGHWLSETL